MEAVDEKTLLKKDFLTEDSGKTVTDNQDDEPEEENIDISEAIETAGFGCGTILFSLGPFLLFCSEGGEIVVLSVVGIMVRCEWELTTFWVTALQVTPNLNVSQNFYYRIEAQKQTFPYKTFRVDEIWH